MPCNSNYTFSTDDSLLKSYGLLSNTPIWKHKADYFAIFIALETDAEHSSFYAEVIHRESTFHGVSSSLSTSLPSAFRHADGNE